MRLRSFYCLTALLVASPAFAESLYDDMDQSFPNAHTIIGNLLGLSDRVPAIRFQVDPLLDDQRFQVTEYSFRLRKEFQTANPIMFSLHQDAGGKPGSVIDIVQVTPVATIVDGGIYPVASNFQPAIERGGLYWISARTSTSWDGAYWQHTHRDTANRTMAFQSPSGEWTTDDLVWTGPALRVLGVAVPEPSTAALASFAAMLLLQRRQTSTQGRCQSDWK
jgi:hypothetical protein